MLLIGLVFYSFVERERKISAYGVLFYDLGKKCVDECSSEKRLELLKKAVFHNPFLSKAHFLIGDIYSNQNNDEEAIKYYLKTVENDRFHFLANLRLGQYYFDNGDDRNALKYSFLGRSSSPQHPEINFLIGNIYEFVGDYRAAITYFSESYREKKTDYLLFKIGKTYHILELEEDARRKLLDLDEMGSEDFANKLREFIKNN